MTETVECQEWVTTSIRVPDTLRGQLDRDAIHNSLVRRAEQAIRKKYSPGRYRAFHRQVVADYIEGPGEPYTRYSLRSYIQILPDAPENRPPTTV